MKNFPFWYSIDAELWEQYRVRKINYYYDNKKGLKLKQQLSTIKKNSPT